MSFMIMSLLCLFPLWLKALSESGCCGRSGFYFMQGAVVKQVAVKQVVRQGSAVIEYGSEELEDPAVISLHSKIFYSWISKRFSCPLPT